MKFTLMILTAVFCIHAFAATDESKTSDEALVQAAETMMKEDRAAVTAPAATETSKKESEIPLILPPKKTEKEAGTPLGLRVGISLALIFVAGGVMLYATRRWARPKDKAASKARIEILHQFHMGPRKSLALVRVAGEVMLIGVTDHNINMLKPVTLIDDELEGLIGKDFNNFLEDEFSVEDVRNALNARA